MDKNIEKIINDLYMLDKNLRHNRDDLKKMIADFIESKPDTGFDSRFKKKLQSELVKRAEELSSGHNQKKGFLPFILENKRYAAAFAAAVIIITLYIPLSRQYPALSPQKESKPEQIAYNLEKDSSAAARSERLTDVPKKLYSTERKRQTEKIKPTNQRIPSLSADSSKNIPAISINENLSMLTEKGLKKESAMNKGGKAVFIDREEAALERKSKSALVSDEKKNYNFNTEQYARIYENDFLNTIDNPLSTFSIDVDTASYANTRRFLNSHRLPPPDAVRIEEFINYFNYNYPAPGRGKPFSITAEIGTCPWNRNNKLVHIGIKGREIPAEKQPPSNLVFLIDVSGSMNTQNKIGLLKKSFSMLVKELTSRSRVAIVVYAGASGLVLPSTPGNEKEKIIKAIDRLRAGGPTAGSAGINLAYKVAMDNFIKGGNNRVILATDGDFNIGPSSDAELIRLIEEKREKGIYLTVLGFGMGNYKDSKMESLADRGNGNYAYIDSIMEAKKVLVTDITSTLFTIAKDVKIQIEFNPAYIKSYRLIGYENRMLKKEDFSDDTKDAGELGAGHTVTALYEIIPATDREDTNEGKPLKYTETRIKEKAYKSREIMTVKLRYKKPHETVSSLIVKGIRRSDREKKLSDNFLFSSAVAEFGMILRRSKFMGKASYDSVLKRASRALGSDRYGYRAEFMRLVRIAKLLDQKKTSNAEQ